MVFIFVMGPTGLFNGFNQRMNTNLEENISNTAIIAFCLLAVGMLSTSFPWIVPAITVWAHFFPNSFDSVRRALADSRYNGGIAIVVMLFIILYSISTIEEEEPEMDYAARVQRIRTLHREMHGSSMAYEQGYGNDSEGNVIADFASTALLIATVFFLPRFWGKLYLFLTSMIPEAYRDSWRNWTSFLQPPSPPRGSIPTSKAALHRLEQVVLEERHLLMESSPSGITCPVCLDVMHIGETVTKMPCKHYFHRECLTPWLEKHNSCPTCRYELETDDAEYEFHRRQRSNNQSPRAASSPVPPTPRQHDEQPRDTSTTHDPRPSETSNLGNGEHFDHLMNLSVVELKAMARNRNISLVGCIEKRDMVCRLLN